MPDQITEADKAALFERVEEELGWCVVIPGRRAQIDAVDLSALVALAKSHPAPALEIKETAGKYVRFADGSIGERSVVDDAMVERATSTYCQKIGLFRTAEGDKGTRAAMRAALIAALEVEG